MIPGISEEGPDGAGGSNLVMKTGGVSDFFQDVKMNANTVHYD